MRVHTIPALLGQRQVVAVAGGTGGVGRAVVDGILERKKWDVVILSRKKNPSLQRILNVPVLEVDYMDQASLENILKEHNIHTVISTLNGSSQSCFDCQASLIDAAAKSGCVKRFAPSEFVTEYADTVVKLPNTDYKLSARNHLKMYPQLEVTLFQNGHFLDYYGQPRYKEYLNSYPFCLSPSTLTASIPGDGLATGVFTLARDVGRFVGAALELQTWPSRSIIVGDRANWSQMLDVAQRARGGQIFRVARDGLEQLGQGLVHNAATLEVEKDQTRAQFALAFAKGDFDLYYRGEILNEMFPEVVPTGVDKFLEEVWRGE